MATVVFEIPATIEWAKLFEANRDNGEYDKETDGATTVDVLVDSEGAQRIKDAGIRKQGKPTEDGRMRFKMKRPWSDKFGRDWAAGAPDVFRPDGTRWDLGTDGVIGNGSTGVVFVEVYDTKMGKGTRLKAVQIIDHVKFESEGGGSSSISVKNYTAESSSAQSKTDSYEDIPF